MAEGFLALAALGTEPWVVVDATGSAEVVAAEVWDAVTGLAGPGGLS